jgi:hypothetical protein
MEITTTQKGCHRISFSPGQGRTPNLLAKGSKGDKMSAPAILLFDVL